MKRIVVFSLFCLLCFISSAQILSQEVVLQIDSLVLSENHHQVTVETTTRFEQDYDDVDLRLVYLVVEDSIDSPEGSLSGILGQLGFNNESFSFEHCEIRDIVPSEVGVEGSIPSSVKAMNDYHYTYVLDLPASIDKLLNVNIFVVLYDAIGGKYVKADKALIPQFEIEEPEDPAITVLQPGTLASMFSADDIKYLKTLKLRGQINGTDIATLRQMTGLMVSEEDTEVKGVVSFLDLSEVQFVVGGSFYIGDFYGVEEMQECVEENAVPDYAFSTDFDHKSTLKTLILPATIKKIGSYAFALNGINAIENTESLEVIGEAAFFNAGLKSFQMSNSLKRIEADAFWGVSGLDVSVIPESVNYIGSNAFGSIESITDIVLPGEVFLDGNPFQSCTNLSSISFSGKSLRYVIDNGLLYTSDYSSLILAKSVSSEAIVIDSRCKVVEDGVFSMSQAPAIVALGVEQFGWTDDIGSIQSIYFGSRIKSISFLGGSKVLNLYLLCQNPPQLNNRSSAIKTVYTFSESIPVYQKDASWRKILNYQSVETSPWYIGLDANSDGKVSVADMCFVIDVIKNDTANVSKGDVNGDGKVDENDLTFVQSLILSE